ncbi:hypothetical protein BGZ60DRAFT_540909 [Tricladium varicosporioides]|nr:hypothetical protein BGZ60DRAFT_540909 [Hymenoscyphus varicosporioides]
MADIPLYFERSWAILSSIGLINALFGFMVVGITGLSLLALVPIIVSVAGAIANGLCFYAFYANYNTTATLTAAIFADLGWLVQEAGLSFYSYLILTRVLKNTQRLIFLSLFWSLLAIISAFRITILICRARNIINGNSDLQTLIAGLHIGYFTSTAVIEMVSAVFLLRKFTVARRTSIVGASKRGLFSYLIQSTEIRLATLALIGITRAVTYSFQTTLNASNITGQIDRFVFTMECMFPMIMYVDILASRVIATNHAYSTSLHNHVGYHKSGRRIGGDRVIALHSINQIETRVTASAQISSSQESIVERERGEALEEEGGDKDRKSEIAKVVEFGFHESV